MWGVACWLSSFVIFQEIRTSIAKKPYNFVIVQGVSGTLSPPPPLDPRMISSKNKVPHAANHWETVWSGLYNNVSDRVIRFLHEINEQDELDTDVSN